MRTLTPSTTAKLFATGFTVGPIVDSFHNQCLLRYDVLPINLEWPAITNNIAHDYPYFFCSSWTVPPLLGVAYVVLGAVLPRIVEATLAPKSNRKQQATSLTKIPEMQSESAPLLSENLRVRALLAVATTALIIKLSEFLETHQNVFDNFEVLNHSVDSPSLSLLVMVTAALSQWALLDRSIAALVVASITAIGGPLAELPFVGHGVWTYLDGAADYFPLQNTYSNAIASIAAIDSNSVILQASEALFGTSNYQDLALSSITGPCYFAVTMDAIALGRWFDSSKSSSIKSS